jgi:hypothetical protein
MKINSAITILFGAIALYIVGFVLYVLHEPPSVTQVELATIGYKESVERADMHRRMAKETLSPWRSKNLLDVANFWIQNATRLQNEEEIQKLKENDKKLSEILKTIRSNRKLQLKNHNNGNKVLKMMNKLSEDCSRR